MKNFLQVLIVALIFIPVYSAAQVGFNTVGYIAATVDTSQSYLGIALDNQNRIIIAGRTQVIQNEDLNALLVRYHSNGTLDTTLMLDQLMVLLDMLTEQVLCALTVIMVWRLIHKVKLLRLAEQKYSESRCWFNSLLQVQWNFGC
jgi:hypothetical protein